MMTSHMLARLLWTDQRYVPITEHMITGTLKKNSLRNSELKHFNAKCLKSTPYIPFVPPRRASGQNGLLYKNVLHFSVSQHPWNFSQLERARPQTR